MRGRTYPHTAARTVYRCSRRTGDALNVLSAPQPSEPQRRQDLEGAPNVKILSEREPLSYNTDLQPSCLFGSPYGGANVRNDLQFGALPPSPIWNAWGRVIFFSTLATFCVTPGVGKAASSSPPTPICGVGNYPLRLLRANGPRTLNSPPNGIFVDSWEGWPERLRMRRAAQGDRAGLLRMGCGESGAFEGRARFGAFPPAVVAAQLFSVTEQVATMANHAAASRGWYRSRPHVWVVIFYAKCIIKERFRSL